MLVVVGVIAALAIGAFAVYTQLGGSTEAAQLAGQIGERAGSQNRMIQSGLRSGKVSRNEFSASVGTMIQNHKFVTGGNSGSGVTGVVTQVIGGGTPALAATAVCGTGAHADSIGFVINLSFDGDAALDLQEMTEFQGQIAAALKSALVDVDGLRATFDYKQTAPVLADLDGAATPTVGSSALIPSTVPVCIDNGI